MASVPSTDPVSTTTISSTTPDRERRQSSRTASSSRTISTAETSVVIGSASPVDPQKEPLVSKSSPAELGGRRAHTGARVGLRAVLKEVLVREKLAQDVVQHFGRLVGQRLVPKALVPKALVPKALVPMPLVPIPLVPMPLVPVVVAVVVGGGDTVEREGGDDRDCEPDHGHPLQERAPRQTGSFFFGHGISPRGCRLVVLTLVRTQWGQGCND